MKSSLQYPMNASLVGPTFCRLMGLCLGLSVQAQPTVNASRRQWHPGGPVNAPLQAGSTAYFSGSFTYVGSQVQLQASPNVESAVWSAVQTAPITDTGSTNEDLTTQTRPRRFFRAGATP